MAWYLEFARVLLIGDSPDARIGAKLRSQFRDDLIVELGRQQFQSAIPDVANLSHQVRHKLSLNVDGPLFTVGRPLRPVECLAARGT